jgi:hypothetical protein
LQDQEPVGLSLLAVLPNAASTAAEQVKSSLRGAAFDYCIYREDCKEAASSYIIRSQENGSRTIVNYNELAEMAVEEFIEIAEKERTQGRKDGVWWHFEVGVRVKCWGKQEFLIWTGTYTRHNSAVYAISQKTSLSRRHQR